MRFRGMMQTAHAVLLVYERRAEELGTCTGMTVWSNDARLAKFRVPELGLSFKGFGRRNQTLRQGAS